MNGKVAATKLSCLFHLSPPSLLFCLESAHIHSDDELSGRQGDHAEHGRRLSARGREERGHSQNVRARKKQEAFGWTRQTVRELEGSGRDVVYVGMCACVCMYLCICVCVCGQVVKVRRMCSSPLSSSSLFPLLCHPRAPPLHTHRLTLPPPRVRMRDHAMKVSCRDAVKGKASSPRASLLRLCLSCLAAVCTVQRQPRERGRSIWVQRLCELHSFTQEALCVLPSDG